MSASRRRFGSTASNIGLAYRLADHQMAISSQENSRCGLRWPNDPGRRCSREHELIKGICLVRESDPNDQAWPPP